MTRLVAGFDSACLVRWSFTDEQGESIPSGRVQSVTLKDDGGVRHRHQLDLRGVLRDLRLGRQRSRGRGDPELENVAPG